MKTAKIERLLESAVLKKLAVLSGSDNIGRKKILLTVAIYRLMDTCFPRTRIKCFKAWKSVKETQKIVFHVVSRRYFPAGISLRGVAPHLLFRDLRCYIRRRVDG